MKDSDQDRKPQYCPRLLNSQPHRGHHPRLSGVQWPADTGYRMTARSALWAQHAQIALLCTTTRAVLQTLEADHIGGTARRYRPQCGDEA
jgi:hypothetical protein